MQETVLQSSRSPIRHLTGVQIISTGSYVPEIVVRNEDLAQMGCDPEWILQRTGIRERRHAPPEMATSDLAVAAAERCIEAAGVATEDIDLLVVGTFSPDLLCPSTACLVQDRLGINGAAFDIAAACAGFIYSLITAMQYVATGTSNLALVIGADTNSRIINPADEKTYPLFGDGAGAALITAGDDDQGLLAYTLGSDGSGAELLYRKMGGSRMPDSPEGLASNLHYLEMEGRPIFKWAVRMIDATVREVLAAAQLEIKDIDALVLHQANSRIMDAAAESLGIPREKLIVNIERYGNTSAGSIPLVLDEICRNGSIQRGSRIMFCGFGAGLAWGTALMQW
jgi:3-oxoacyl-[acyl-carrier-protein] synthase-3